MSFDIKGSKNKVLNTYGGDLRDNASAMTTPFIHFAGCEVDGTAINYGNIGDSTFAHDTSNITPTSPFASAPYITGNVASPFENTSLFFSGEGTDSELLQMCDPGLNQGALLFFGRVKLTDVNYKQTILAIGDIGAGNDFMRLEHNSGSTTNSLILQYKIASGLSIKPSLLDGVTLDGTEKRILVLVDRVNGQVISQVNDTAGTLVSDIPATDFTGLTSITDAQTASTFGNGDFLTISPGVRATDNAVYLANDWRDFMLANVTLNVDKVVTNFAAIAQAFKQSPVGYLPTSLKDLIE